MYAYMLGNCFDHPTNDFYIKNHINFAVSHLITKGGVLFLNHFASLRFTLETNAAGRSRRNENAPIVGG
jgi:hypothetical protein